MRIEIIFQGFPGKLASGYMGWSSVVYVEAKEKKILYDTGGPGKRNDICKRLLAIGVRPADIDILVLSHFHDDHVYNFDYFTNAQILLHEKEAQWVLSEPDDWPQPKFLYPVVEKTKRLRLISSDREIALGVQALHVPGHTPGCMALVLRDANLPTTVLAGDAVKNMFELATAEAAMSHNAEATKNSIVKIRNIAQIVIPGHDRTLKIDAGFIEAISSLHETIVVPAGVADPKPRRYEIKLEPTRLRIIKNRDKST